MERRKRQTAWESGESTLELLERVRDGNRSALSELYQRYLPVMLQWARGRLPGSARDLVDTGDLVQEALLKTLRTVETFQGEHSGSFHAYLCQAVRNRVTDEWRRASRRPPVDDLTDFIPSRDSSPIENAIGRELFSRYRAALAKLSVSDREAVLGRLELALSYAQLAQALNKPTPDAARMTFTRALVRLAEEMGGA